MAQALKYLIKNRVMKKGLMFIVLLSAVAFGQHLDSGKAYLPTRAEQPAFQVGEYLKYRVHYGFIDAGYAELEVKEAVRLANRDVLHIKGFGRSTGLVEWTFKTRDYYETYFDPVEMVPVEFIRDIDEGGYKTKRHILFDREDQTAVDLDFDEDSTFRITSQMQDLFSAFYFSRSLDASGLKKGDKIPIEIFLDHEPFEMQLKFLGRETIKSDFGKIRCMKFRPVVQDGRVFRDEDSVELWISDDENKIPVLVKSKLLIGSLKMELVDYRNIVSAFKTK